MKRTIALLLALLLLLCCGCSSKEEPHGEPGSGKTLLGVTGGAHSVKYGNIENFVDADGTVFADIVSDGIVWVRAEHMDKYAWIGFEAEKPLPAGMRFRVNWLNMNTREYDSALDRTDNRKSAEWRPEFFELSVEDDDGIAAVQPAGKVYILSDALLHCDWEDICACMLTDGADEILPTAFLASVKNAPESGHVLRMDVHWVGTLCLFVYQG